MRTRTRTHTHKANMRRQIVLADLQLLVHFPLCASYFFFSVLFWRYCTHTQMSSSSRAFPAECGFRVAGAVNAPSCNKKRQRLWQQQERQWQWQRQRQQCHKTCVAVSPSCYLFLPHCCCETLTHILIFFSLSLSLLASASKQPKQQKLFENICQEKRNNFVFVLSLLLECTHTHTAIAQFNDFMSFVTIHSSISGFSMSYAWRQRAIGRTTTPPL